jgi:hypothetical protein
MFDKKITTKHGISEYRTEDSNNLFPTRAEESANHQASKVYFGN